jgi:NAD(P)-dependent dehydrogenase (short-subunit alcohol dehydrogenase family)
VRTIMITGSTQGLGLQIAKQLARMPDTHVIMAVRNVEKGRTIARELGENVTAARLDLSSLGDVARFAKGWNRKLDGLVNNAGVQFSSGDNFTPDSFEETIAVNHLAAFLLTLGLEKHLSGGRVLFIGSGTQDPKHPHARFFGFRGARFTTVDELAAGKASSDEAGQRNMDRYASSKFLNTITAVEIAKRNKAYEAYVLDPGLMPGTGLARTQNRAMRLLWKWLLPFAGLFLPDTSSPYRSAKTAAWIMTAPSLGYPNGTIFSYTKKPSKHICDEMINSGETRKAVYEQSLRIVEGFMK